MGKKHIQTQPGAPDFDGAAAYELHGDMEFIRRVKEDYSCVSECGKFRLILVEEFDELIRLAERDIGLSH